MDNDEIKPGEQLTLAQINRLCKQSQALQQGEKPEADPLKMKVDDLKVWLTGKGIEFDASAKKEDLQALVPKE